MNIDDFLSGINKKYGNLAAFRMGGATYESVPSIPTGSIALNDAIGIGIGGYPQGRIIELLGNPSSGKTTMALHAVAEMQKMGRSVLYIDAEHSLDKTYASAIGVNVDDLVLNQPEYGEQGLQIMEEAIRSGIFGLCIVDSVSALVPKRELDGDIGDAHVGLQARMMSQTCRKITGPMSTKMCTVIFVNQYRLNVSTTGFGGPTKTASGGRALDYYSSLIIDFARISTRMM